MLITKTKDLRNSSVAATLIFISIFYSFFVTRWAFVLTAPSDPLQYVAPALNPKLGFDFLDRISVWLWIRAVAILPIPRVLVGGISTLIVMLGILLVASHWLIRKSGLFACAIFFTLFVLSPISFPISTYTYPIQPMTLVILIAVIVSQSSRAKRPETTIGALCLVAITCKVQAYSYVLFSIGRILRKRTRWLAGVSFLIGALGSLCFVIFVVFVLDGSSQVTGLWEKYFAGGVGSGQFSGRKVGGFPPFHRYLLEPTAIIAIAGMIIPFMRFEFKKYRPFAYAAIVQSLGLLAIYLITQRGGPLIYPYSLDAFVLGAIPFAGCVGELLKNFGESNRTKIILFISFALSSTLALEVFGRIIGNDAFIALAETKEYKVLATLATWSGLVLIFVIATRKLSKYIRSGRSMILFGALFLCLVGVVLRSETSISDSVNKRTMATRYHDVASAVDEIDNSPVAVVMSLNGESAEMTAARLASIFNTFYAGEGSDVDFAANIQGSEDLIVTNDLVILYDSTRELWTSTNETISWKNELNRLNSLNSQQTKGSFALSSLDGLSILPGQIIVVVDSRESSLATSIVIEYRLENSADKLEFPLSTAQSIATMTIFADSQMTVDSISLTFENHILHKETTLPIVSFLRLDSISTKEQFFIIDKQLMSLTQMRLK